MEWELRFPDWAVDNECLEKIAVKLGFREIFPGYDDAAAIDKYLTALYKFLVDGNYLIEC